VQDLDSFGLHRDRYPASRLRPKSFARTYHERLFKMPAAKTKRRYVIRFSSTHGHGAFASCAIRKGTRIIEYQGKRSSWKKARRRPPTDADDPFHTFIFGLDDGTVIDASIGGNAARWINHSCEPNCEAFEEEDGRVFIYSKRTIRAGEELTYDYLLTTEGRVRKRTRKEFACYCGAENCRGTMLELEG
jgi:SET domain-containing protein